MAQGRTKPRVETLMVQISFASGVADLRFLRQTRGSRVLPSPALVGVSLLPCAIQPLVGVHMPRSLFIFLTSNVGSPDWSLAFLPTNSTRCPDFSVSPWAFVRL